MDQIKKLLTSLSLRQKVSIGLAAILVLASVYGLTSRRRSADFKPLYTGVAAEDAGVIIQKIKESGVEYHLSDSGGVISVPSANVAELRLQLAAAGLPKSGRIGFELFDKTTFGSTEFVEHINYGRALEGELEKSVSSMAAIEQARVHVTFGKDSVFTESREPAKASVVLKLRPAMALTPRNVVAIQQLVASAVEGLNAEAVSVVDTDGVLLSRKKNAALEATSDAYTYRQRVEHDLLEKINATLEPMLGREMYRAAVSVDTDITSGEQSEETYDPTKSVMTNSQKTEEVAGGSTVSGIPGSASNLPRPPARLPGGGTSTSRRTENVSYETSHLIRKTLLPQGGIKRISASVLLNQRVKWEGKGSAAKQIFIPPTPETIKAVHDIVAGMTGFTQERGDQIVVETVAFQAMVDQAPPPADVINVNPQQQKKIDWRAWMHDTTILIGAGVGAALVLILVMVAFFLRRKRQSRADASVVGAQGIAAAPDTDALPALTPAEKVQAALDERAALQEEADQDVLNSFKIPIVKTRKTELLVKELRSSAKKDSTISAQVLQAWISGTE